MKTPSRILLIFSVLLGLSLVFMTSSGRNLIAQSDPDREIYDDNEEFQKLSGAAQSLLESRYGKKQVVDSASSNLLQAPFALARSIVSFALTVSDEADEAANVLVNLVPDASALDTQSETTLVLGSGSTIVVGFNDSGSYVPSLPNHFTGFSRSTDSGTSFIDLGTLPLSLNGDAGDPVLARHNATDAIFLSTLQFIGSGRIQVFKSVDTGFSFGAPVNGAPGVTGFQDKEWITVDNFPGAGNGNVYLTWRDFGAGNGVKFTRSMDAGATFAPSGGVLIASAGTFNVQGAFVTVGPDHAVHVFWLDQSAGSGTPNLIRMRKSTDQGLTFGSAVTVATLNTRGVNGSLAQAGGFRTNAFPQAAVNPVNGDLYVVYADCSSAPCASAADHGNVFLRRSTDGGATWGAAAKVNDDAGTQSQFMPVITVTPNGQQLFVGWYDRRLGPETIIDRFGSIASINLAAGGAVTFLPNQRITTASFPVVIGQDPVVNPVYMGDYDQAVSDVYSFHMTWGDNRLPNPNVPSHVHQPDVRYSRTSMVPVDVKPGGCRNPFNLNSHGVLPVAINGTAGLDVNQIDPASVRLDGVPAIRWDLEDVSAPYFPLIGKSGALACTSAGPDGITDLTLKFDSEDLAAALGPVSDGDVVVVRLTGTLLPAFGGYPFIGEDVVAIIKKK